MPDGVALERVREAMHRLFIATAGSTLRKEDEQKSRELAALLPRLLRVAKGAHVVDAAAGKASVGLVAAELGDNVERLTVIERDAARIAACRAAAARLSRSTVVVDVVQAELADESAWPREPDVVVALHACGGAADLVIDRAAESRARQVMLVPCCYGDTVPFRARAAETVAKMPWAADDVLRRRMTASLVDMERKLRLEAAGYETEIEELVAPTVTPHNLVFLARRTSSSVRIARAEARLASLRAAADVEW